MVISFPSFWASLAALFVLLSGSGCALTGPCARHMACKPFAPETSFEKIGTIDLRQMSIADYQAMVRPGDLIVNTMRLGRVVRQREWLFAVIPQGHSMIVIDPEDLEHGIFECRFQGAKRVGARELNRYSYSTLYRLHNAERLNLERLREFADHGCSSCGRYAFRGWLGINPGMMPDTTEEMCDQYTCSTMAVAAYHYSGVDFEFAFKPRQVVTPRLLANSAGQWNEHALMAPLHRP